VRTALLAVAANFSGDVPRKVRLLAGADGHLHVAHEELESPRSASTPNGRVCFAPQPTDSNDRMLFHKTTHRALYDQSFRTAAHAGFCDVLFLNQRGEVTEGAISNLFVEKEGRWSTPPVECGLLPGVYRRYLLQTQPGIEQRILTIEDVQNADAIYLTNAVRGLRRVRLTGKNEAAKA
jgi:para-aminobenzoate synthetase / 4-amino-4-deoxychorismate lyase